jgi:hypothetical protein
MQTLYPVNAAKALYGTAMEGFQRAEAGIANPIRSLLNKESGEDAFQSFLSGIKGEEYGQLGDIARDKLYGKMPPSAVEALAGAGGMAGMSAILGGAKGLQKGIQKGAKYVSRPQKLLRMAKGVKGSVDDLIVGAKNTYGKIYSMPMKSTGEVVDDVIIATKHVRDVVKGLPAKVKKLIPTKGKLKSSIKDIREAMMAVSDDITSTDWSKAEKGMRLKATKHELMEAKKVLKKLILDNVDEDIAKDITKNDELYTILTHQGHKLRKTVYDNTSKMYKTKGILSWFKDTEKSGEREVFEELSKFSPKLRDLYKAYASDAGWQSKIGTAKNIAWKYGPWIAGGSILKGALGGGKD